MKLSHSPPKLQWVIKLFFPGYNFEKVVGFAFGDTIYSKEPLEDHNLIHEETHLRQMGYSKWKGIIHFIRFAFSRKFRYNTEVEAYREEYLFLKRKYPQAAERAAVRFAELLAGKNSYIFGKVAEYDEALYRILNG